MGWEEKLYLSVQQVVHAAYHMGKKERKKERHRSLDPREGKRDTAATAREESAHACPHSRRRLTSLGGLQKYPKIHVSTVEESSGSCPNSSQGLFFFFPFYSFLCIYLNTVLKTFEWNWASFGKQRTWN